MHRCDFQRYRSVTCSNDKVQKDMYSTRTLYVYNVHVHLHVGDLILFKNEHIPAKLLGSNMLILSITRHSTCQC